jgi:hypothetical protein
MRGGRGCRLLSVRSDKEYKRDTERQRDAKPQRPIKLISLLVKYSLKYRVQTKTGPCCGRYLDVQYATRSQTRHVCAGHPPPKRTSVHARTCVHPHPVADQAYAAEGFVPGVVANGPHNPDGRVHLNRAHDCIRWLNRLLCTGHEGHQTQVLQHAFASSLPLANFTPHALLEALLLHCSHRVSLQSFQEAWSLKGFSIAPLPLYN